MTYYRKTLLLLSIALLIFSQVNAGHVVTLTDDNFEKLTSQGKWILDFFAPWCPHCQQLEGVFEEAALRTSKMGIGVRYGKIDCTVETGLATRFAIDAYPSVKYYRQGVISDYEGGHRDVHDFYLFAQKVTSPPVVIVNNEKDLMDLTANPVSFILLYKSDDDYKAYTAIAEKYQDSMVFAATKNPQLFSFYPIIPKLALVWLNDGEPQIFGAKSEKLDSVGAEEWIKARRYPHFVLLDANSWRQFSTVGKPIVVGVIPDSVSPDKTPLYTTLQTIALTNTDFLFGRLDGRRYETFVNAYTAGTAQPTFFVIDAVKQVYWFNATIGTDVKKVGEYLDAITKGEIAGTTAATSTLSAMVNFLSTFFGDMLEDPLILVFVIVIFICIVIAAVWFISEPSSANQNSTATTSNTGPTNPKQHAEKPGSGDAKHQDKVKKD